MMEAGALLALVLAVGFLVHRWHRRRGAELEQLLREAVEAQRRHNIRRLAAKQKAESEEVDLEAIHQEWQWRADEKRIRLPRKARARVKQALRW